jgi:hypothetical protein
MQHERENRGSHVIKTSSNRLKKNRISFLLAKEASMASEGRNVPNQKKRKSIQMSNK